MSTAMTIANLAIVAIVLLKDWGHRRVTLFAVFRPVLLTAVIVPFVMPGWDLSGRGGLLVVSAALLGAALGVAASAFMKVSTDQDGQTWTDAGVGYAAFWIAVCVGRQAFIYGCQHWFTKSLGAFLVDNRISVHAFADSILLFTLGMVVVLRLAILARGRLASAQLTVQPTA